jgi:hypothetical protein
MQVRKSTEAKRELREFSLLDEGIGEGIRECLDRIELDVLEDLGRFGSYSVEPIQVLKARRVHVFRVKDESIIPGLRILFFRLPGKRGYYVTGIHRRDELYDPLREPLTRAQRYYGMRGTL